MTPVAYDLRPIRDAILAECREDHVGLWTIIWHLRRMGVQESQETRRLTMSLSRDLLSAGMLAGTPTPDGRGFVPWSASASSILSRIEEAWDALGHEPNIGDIVWFTAPSA